MKNTLNGDPLRHAKFLPLVMIHGACGNPSQFERMAEGAREQGYSSHLITLRYHASRPQSRQSKKNLGNLSVHDYVADVRREVEKIGPCILIGHSMGGIIALKLAEDNANVKGVALLNSVAPRGILFLSLPVLRRIPRYLLALCFNRAWQFTPKHARALLFNATPPETASRLIEKLVLESGRAGRECAFGLIPVDQSRVRAAKVLVIAGGLDKMAPRHVQEKIAHRYAAEFHCLHNADHMSHITEDGWRPCINVILRWAEKTLFFPSLHIQHA